MKKESEQSEELMDSEATRMELVKRAAECRYSENVICGLWEKNPARCERCNWNPGKGRPKENDK